MSHKCIRCGNLFEDNDASILRGCPNCGSIFFLYIKDQEDLKRAEEIEKELKEKDTSLEKEIEKRVEEVKRKEKAEEKEVKRKVRKARFGIETVRIPREGVYEINLDALMKSKPLIVLEKGKIYFVHLPSAFEELD
ncbi:MAG: Zn-ribbon containing protein [Candidatus Aenigmatarchaeota archaeon]